jgi:hypothetical protein
LGARLGALTFALHFEAAGNGENAVHNVGGMMGKRVCIGVIGVLAAGLSWGYGSAGASPSAPVGGTESLNLVFGGTSTSGPIVAAGAFTDAGVDRSLGNSGNDKIVLSKGTFMLNHSAVRPSFRPDAKTCSIISRASGPVVVSKGTGAYKGIGGTISATVTLYYVAQRTPKGSCDSKSAPLGGYTEVQAAGRITFKP